MSFSVIIKIQCPHMSFSFHCSEPNLLTVPFRETDTLGNRLLSHKVNINKKKNHLKNAKNVFEIVLCSRKLEILIWLLCIYPYILGRERDFKGF